MTAFENASFDAHEQIVYCNDKETGLKAIIAIHDTTLGPALGGTRLWNYHSTEEALTDVLRLSRGMTYKAAIAGLRLGGGKAVIIGDPALVKSEALFRAYGRFVDSLGGRYITAEDVNIRVGDMEHIAKETEYYAGGSAGSGDPSPVTALGVFEGIKATVFHKLGRGDLRNVKIAVQGVGSVGRHLCQYLAESGVKIFVSDINEQNARDVAEKYNATVVDTKMIHAADVDVFAPCALGGILDSKTIPEIKASVVAGGANNQLLSEKVHGAMILKRGILLAPDYVINAGGLINCYQELLGYDRQEALAKARKIYDTLLDIYKLAESQSISTIEASNQLAEKRLKDTRKTLKSTLRNSLKHQDWYNRKAH